MRQVWVPVVALLVYGMLASSIAMYDAQASDSDSAAGSKAWSVSGQSGSTRPPSLEKRVLITQYISQPFVRIPFLDPTYAWMLRLELVHALEPIQMAATFLIPFYDHMREQLVEQWRQGTVLRSMRWQLGAVVLEMRSGEPGTTIPPGVVFEMLGVLRGFAQRDMVGTFQGEVVSVMTGWSIWVRLRIAGVAEPSWGRGR